MLVINCEVSLFLYVGETSKLAFYNQNLKLRKFRTMKLEKFLKVEILRTQNWRRTSSIAQVASFCFDGSLITETEVSLYL